MATYSNHVVVLTGQDDWKSRVEEDGVNTAWGDFTRKLKFMTTRGGEYADPFINNLVTAGSFKFDQSSINTSSALIFPNGLLIQGVEVNDPNDQSIKTFITQYLQKGSDRSDISPSIPSPTPLTQPTILICGHGGRDQRCGILGPLLKTEFERHLPSAVTSTFSPSAPQVGLISHIGGHKFAGNIIIYIPPEYPASSLASSSSSSSSGTFTATSSSFSFTDMDLASTEAKDSVHPLAGKGIWYGRVEPKHVEGIIQETIVHGNVIRELFRGGIGIGGEVLRLPLELNLKPRRR